MVEILLTDRRRPWETLLLGFPPNLLARELHLGRVTAELASPSAEAGAPRQLQLDLAPCAGPAGARGHRGIILPGQTDVRAQPGHSLAATLKPAGWHTQFTFLLPSRSKSASPAPYSPVASLKPGRVQSTQGHPMTTWPRLPRGLAFPGPTRLQQ